MFLPFYTKQNSRAFSKLILAHKPQARAMVKGSRRFPSLHGCVEFYPSEGGTLVAAEFYKLPSQEGACFALQIHRGGRCSGTVEDPFSDAGERLAASAARDSRLLPCQGYVYQVFFTDQFVPDDVVGRTAVLHELAGVDTKMGCGVILRS